MKTTIEKSELELALTEFSKFDIEKRGHALCAKVNMYIRLDCDDEDSLPPNYNAVKELTANATIYRNLFPNQVAVISEFILSINDDRFNEGVLRILNNDFNTFGV